jgi:heat shock protein HslJ
MKIELGGTLKGMCGVMVIAAHMIGLGGCGLSDGAALPGAPSAEGESSKAGMGTIPAGTWRLASMRQAGEAEIVISQPDAFTAEFGSDGRVGLVADCNRCGAGYSAGDRSLSVGLMACTRAYCVATAPQDTTYTALVESARAWSVSGDGRLELASDAGTLRFQR